MPEHVTAERRGSSVAFLDTWPPSVTIFWRKKHGACWLGSEGEMVTRDGKVGLVRGLQFVDSFFYSLKNWGLIIFPPFVSDSGETVNQGLWRRACVVFILACEYVSSAPLSLVSAQCLTKRAKCHTCHWKLTSAIALVYCTQKRCHAQTTPWLSLLSSALPALPFFTQIESIF